MWDIQYFFFNKIGFVLDGFSQLLTDVSVLSMSRVV